MRTSKLVRCLSQRLGLALSLATTLTLAGCQTWTPVAIRQCSIQAAPSDQVAFGADIRNDSSKVANKVYVLVITTGRREQRVGERGTGGSLVEYAFTGRFLPGQWAHQVTLKNIDGDDFTLDQHFGAISSCYVHAVEYQDGTHWLGPAPG